MHRHVPTSGNERRESDDYHSRLVEETVAPGGRMTRPTIEPGTRIADFVVDALIGTGGMGQVYRANQVGVDRPVALKVLAPQLGADPEFVERFRREARMMRDLEHPSILTVYAAGEDAGSVYLAARLVPGPTLQQVLGEGGPMVSQALDILRPIAEGLDYAHSRGVIHRDIKPANVLLDPNGRPFLADFGISKELGSVVATATGQYLGSPRYMAPEQAGNGAFVGHRADLYALACVAFEMVTGSAPYTDEDTVPLLLAHATQPIPRATARGPALPGAVDAVFDRGLAKSPADRFPSARSFVEALDAALAGSQVAAPTTKKSRHAVAVAGTAAVLVAALVAVLVLLPDAPTPSATDATPATSTPPPPPALVAAPVPVPSTPELAGVARGALAYEAAMDGTPRGFVVALSTEADSAREDIRYVPGALELEAVAPGADTYTELDVSDGVTTYVGEIDLSVRPGSDLELCWSLRWAVPRKLSNYWCLDTATESAQFSVYRRGEGRAPIGSPATVTGLQSGHTVRVALVVRDEQLSMYLDDRLVIDVVNDQVPLSGTLPGIEMEAAEGTGLIRIEGLRIYDLASTS